MSAADSRHPEPALSFRAVNVERSGTPMLTDIDWELQPANHCVVFGPNGAGKTTLLNVILGYLWPTSGDVHVLGMHYGEVDLRELRRSIAVVSDSIRRMIDLELTGLEVIATGPRAHLSLFTGLGARELAHAEETADSVRLPAELLKRPFEVMSTGERQRVLIARALASRSKLLILDEPAAGLDLAGREFVLETIAHVAALDHAPTMLLTTHHIEEIPESFRAALLLKRGKILAAGAIEHVFTSENVSALFEMPLMVQRIGSRWSGMRAQAGGAAK